MLVASLWQRTNSEAELQAALELSLAGENEDELQAALLLSLAN